MSLLTTSKYEHQFEQFFSEHGFNLMADPKQHEYVEAMIEPSKHVRGVFCDSLAGTGKTTVALLAGVYGLQMGRFDRIIYIRNSTPVEQIGFLPGDLEGKMGESLAVCTEALDHTQPGLAQQLLKLQSVFGDEKQLVLKPIAYLRGKDFAGEPLIIIDEAQNLTVHQLQTVLTRPHDTAKIVVIGSSAQVDPDNVERIGLDKLLGFQVFALHFEWNPSMRTKTIHLEKNYRGEFSQYADRIHDTVKWLGKNTIYDSEGNKINERLVTSNGTTVCPRRRAGVDIQL